MDCILLTEREKGGRIMKLSDLRKVVPEDTTLWLQDNESGDCLAVNENRYIDENFNDFEVHLIYPEKYPAISSSGMTVCVDYKEHPGDTFKFQIKGFEACDNPYFYSETASVDITVFERTKTNAIEKAESVLESKIHKSTMKITVMEV